MVTSPITKQTFQEILPSICDRETSQDPAGWTPENPLWGHCAVVSLVAQNLFGGNLMRTSLEKTKFAASRSHYINQIIDESGVPFKHFFDFTAGQFGEDYPDQDSLDFAPKERSYVLSFAETVSRYKLLSWRLAEKLSKDNPLFDDGIYRECFYSALDSTCQKMWFGSAIRHDKSMGDYGIAYSCANSQITALGSMCEPRCIRFSIQSRTESMLGACGHAEERALWYILNERKDLNIKDCDIFIAGFHTTGMPWIKSKPEHTCLRCAVQMFNARPRRIYVPVIDRWEGISPTEALEIARDYATKDKLV